ncbi:MAG TPA: hypothetical protein VLI90_17565 [Tepidisphaeraceae bacterium]|nr:hypothetical protein [Tepidisphaeraceae bacterium]
MLIDRSLQTSNDHPTVDIQNDVANVHLDLSPDALATGGPPQQRRWAGAACVFKLEKDKWKLNLDRTMNLQYRYALNDPQADKDATLLRLGNAITDGLNDVANQVENGQIDTATDASAAVEKSAQQAFTTCGVQLANSDLLPASVR